MKRYQVYLNPHTVSVFDELQKYTNITRSKTIRLALDRVADNLKKVSITNNKPKKKYILDSLVGFIKIKGKGKTNYAQKHDSIYLRD